MKAYFANLSTARCLMLTIPALMVAYPVVTVVLPAVFRAVTPPVVRTMLSLL
jgi:hypothetical protein